MKKYCFTDCFKRKMSKGWKNTIETVAIIGMIAAFIAAYTLLGTGLGYLLVEILHWMELGDKDSYTGIGVGVITLVLVGTVILYHVYQFARNRAVQLSNFAKARYEGEPFKCSIFEECKDEEPGRD